MYATDHSLGGIFGPTHEWNGLIFREARRGVLRPDPDVLGRWQETPRSVHIAIEIPFEAMRFGYEVAFKWLLDSFHLAGVADRAFSGRGFSGQTYSSIERSGF